MYTSLILLLPLLPFTFAAVPAQSRPRPATHPNRPDTRELIKQARHEQLGSRMTDNNDHAGQRMVRRKKDRRASSDCNASTSTEAVAEILSFATNGDGGVLHNLFPVGRGKASWTTADADSSAISFNAALKPLSAGKLPSQSNAPNGANALVANYPAGTFGLTGSGYSFYSEGSHNGVLTSGAKEVLFSYSIYFENGFDFVKGGKLPGLYGGTNIDVAKSCSGGRQDGRDECFSARMMWRTDGAGEFYNYYPTSIQQGNGYCQTAPYSICDTTYGDSIGRGSFTWQTGQWVTVAQRLKLNDIGQSNGEQQLWINGESIMNLSQLQIRVNGDTKIYGIMAQTFFGGHDASWASPKDQSVWFKDWSLAVLN